MTMRNSQIQKEDILQDNSSIYSAIVGYNKGTMPDLKKKDLQDKTVGYTM